MRLLLDENISSWAAHELSQAGHDVLRVAEVSPSVDDEGVLALARDDSRTLVTFDSDFGDLIFKVGLKPPPGIIYLRMHPIDSRLVAAWVQRALELPVDRAMVVVTEDAVRRRQLAKDRGSR
jgi:predicted nuclease of predicted toxin-antitoxin system